MCLDCPLRRRLFGAEATASCCSPRISTRVATALYMTLCIVLSVSDSLYLTLCIMSVSVVVSVFVSVSVSVVVSVSVSVSLVSLWLCLSLPLNLCLPLPLSERLSVYLARMQNAGQLPAQGKLRLFHRSPPLFNRDCAPRGALWQPTQRRFSGKPLSGKAPLRLPS